jgi:phosphohistidine phosphatase SixA
MRVYIVRHGKAEDAASGVPVNASARERDFARELLELGREQAAYLGRTFGAMQPRPGVIVASRYPRAITTARIIQEHLGSPLRTDSRLEVDHPVAEALAVLAEEFKGATSDLVLVAHNPQLSDLVATLCPDAALHEAMLRTGECVVVELDSSLAALSGRIVGRERLPKE